VDPDRDTRILRVTDTRVEQLVAWFELRYVPANRFNLATSRLGRVSFGLRSPVTMRPLYGLPLIKPRQVR
jgi:hypothetical protein